MNSDERWKNYLPALFAFGLALIVMLFPVLATLLVAGGLVSFGVIFAFVVHKIHKAQDRAKQMGPDGSTIDAEFSEVNDPNFRNVTVFIAKKGRIFTDDF